MNWGRHLKIHYQKFKNLIPELTNKAWVVIYDDKRRETMQIHYLSKETIHWIRFISLLIQSNQMHHFFESQLVIIRIVE